MFGIKDSTKFIGALFKSTENDNPFDEVQKQVGELKKEEVSPTNLSMSPLPSKKLQSQQFQQQQQQQVSFGAIAPPPPPVLQQQTQPQQQLQTPISPAVATSNPVPASPYTINYSNNTNMPSPLNAGRPPLLYGNSSNYPSSML